VASLDWPDCTNVRDLGGLPTGNRQLLTGAIIRADNLTRLTEPGQRSLVAYGVRCVIDLRDPRELERFPYPFPVARLPNVVVKNVPLISDLNWDAMKDPELKRDGYVLIPKLSASNLVGALTAIAGAPLGGVVVHCNQGRERTGVLIACLLALLRVDDETIGVDWTMSDPTTMEASWILAVLEYMRSSEGTVERFLQAAGLRAETVVDLHSRLLGP
jgi:protein-tyrosine phosphatase